MPFTGTYKTNEELGKVNPRRIVPSIDDNGLYLSERYMPVVNINFVIYIILYLVELFCATLQESTKLLITGTPANWRIVQE